MTKFGIALLAFLLVMSCNPKVLVIDPSPQAVQAGDWTLMVSACEAMPGRGADICRVKEGQPIQSVWRLIVPIVPKVLISGELTVYYKGVSKTYAIREKVIEVPWKDLVNAENWHREHDGTALAIAQIRWRDAQGIENIWKARGLAEIMVLEAGYDPMPLDSGFAATSDWCKIQYSTSGRSSIRCQQ